MEKYLKRLDKYLKEPLDGVAGLVNLSLKLFSGYYGFKQIKKENNMSLDVYIHTNDKEVYSSNITHNLVDMAYAVSDNFYTAIWCPEELFENPTTSDITPIIEDGLKELVSNKDKYLEHEPENGWGSYDSFVIFVINYLQHLKRYPNEKVDTWR